MRFSVYLGWAGLVWAAMAQAQTSIQSFVPSETEMRVLPQYCVVKFKSSTSSVEWKNWRDQLGPNYIDIHHYCAGLNFINRYYAVAARDKAGMLQGAKRNFEYMIRAAKPGFPLHADMYLQHGITLRLLKQPGGAVKDFQKAIEINPRLTRAYQELITLYKANKQTAVALETAVAGLRQNPDSKALQKQYLELGGKLPFPEPATAVAETPPANAAEPAPTAPSTTAPAVTETAPVATTPPPDQAEPPRAIGMPGNPYCRFCPPPETAQ